MTPSSEALIEVGLTLPEGWRLYAVAYRDFPSLELHQTLGVAPDAETIQRAFEAHRPRAAVKSILDIGAGLRALQVQAAPTLGTVM